MQKFILSLIDSGLSVKTVKDIYITFKMLLYYAMERFGVAYVKYRVQFPTPNMGEVKSIEVYTEVEQRKIISDKKNVKSSEFVLAEIKDSLLRIEKLLSK